jgi:hypothetical protein
MSVKSAAKANPATSASGLGLVVVAIGTQLGWGAQTIATVSTVALALVPIVRGAVAWYEARHPAKL